MTNNDSKVTSQPIKLLIAEDSARDREFLDHSLSQHYKLNFVTNGTEALETIKGEQYDNILSDIQMPGINGIEFAKTAWAQYPHLKIVFWTQHQDEIYVRSLADAVPAETVYGYVLKDNSTEILLKAVHSVYIEEQCWIDSKIRPVQARIKRSDTSISDLEYEVLIDIALGLTDNVIAKRRFLSRRGVQNRLRSLYEKLGIDQSNSTDKSSHELLNLRSRAISISLRRGLINQHELDAEEKDMQRWLNK